MNLDSTALLYRPTTSVSRVCCVFTICAAVTCLYVVCLKALSRSKKPYATDLNWLTRINSTINAILVAGLATLALVRDGTELTEHPLHVHSPYLVLAACCLTAYTLVDSAMVLKMLELCSEGRMENYFYLVHHLMTIYLSLVVIVYDYLPFFATIRMLSEFSTPLVNLRWFALKSGYANTLVFRVLQTLTLVTFVSCRVMLIAPFWLWLRQTATPSRREDLLGRLSRMVSCQQNRPTAYMKPHHELMASAALILDVLNCLWATKLAQMTVRSWLRRSQKTKAKNHIR